MSESNEIRFHRLQSKLKSQMLYIQQKYCSLFENAEKLVFTKKPFILHMVFSMNVVHKEHFKSSVKVDAVERKVHCTPKLTVVNR